MKLKLIALFCLSSVTFSIVSQQPEPYRALLQQRIDRIPGVIEFDDLLKHIPGLKPQQLMLEVIKVPTFIMFYQTDCPACDDMHEVLKQLDKQMKQIHFNVRVITVNAAKYKEIGRLFGVSRTPKFAMYNKGMLIRGSEFYARKELHELINHVRVCLQ
ncbi:hypothetical protein A3F06_00855 [candidate division TM6 bacterium RIFCSPHIGHO2_12_FULL_36_22]|nr:MAG: hypothetical protein A3F06_00855 [candidate division TM6 bacterium RIFCSPHIGHO2_12_FULL_36_22]